MKVCFVGLGSIATRHIKNLKELYSEEIKIDILKLRFSESTNSQMNISKELEPFIENVFWSVEELPCDYDVIFITNPTRLHYETLRLVHNHSNHFFIEKPVFENGTEDVSSLDLRGNSIYYVACPLRYTNVIQYLKENIDFSEIYSVRCISSSYLPDWRPGTDYRNTYSAKKELGGGVSIDLIHEWDYLYYLFGEPLQVKSIISKKSNLEINSDDIAIYIAEYKDKLAELHLDYFGKKTIRKIELFGHDDSIEADLINQRIIWRKSEKVLDLSQDRNDFQKKELLHFFDIIEGKAENNNNIWSACRTLRITKGE